MDVPISLRIAFAVTVCVFIACGIFEDEFNMSKKKTDLLILVITGMTFLIVNETVRYFLS